MQSSLPRNLYNLDLTQGEIEWRKYLQNIEMEKKEPKSYAADSSESHFDPAALPIIGRFEQRTREAENVTQKNIFSPTDEIPVSRPRGAAVQPESKMGSYMEHMLDGPPGYDATIDYDSHYDPVTHTYRVPLNQNAPHNVKKEREAREAVHGVFTGRRLVSGHGATADPTDIFGQRQNNEILLESRETPEWNPIMQRYYSPEREAADLKDMTNGMFVAHKKAIENRLRAQPYDPVKWQTYDIVHGLSEPDQSPHEPSFRPSPPKSKSMQDSTHIQQILNFSPVKVPHIPTRPMVDSLPTAQHDHVQRLIRQIDLKSQIQAAQTERKQRLANETPIERDQVYELLDTETALHRPTMPERPEKRRLEGPVDAEGGVPGVIQGVKNSRHIAPHRTFKMSQMFPPRNMTEESDEALGSQLVW